MWKCNKSSGWNKKKNFFFIKYKQFFVYSSFKVLYIFSKAATPIQLNQLLLVLVYGFSYAFNSKVKEVYMFGICLSHVNK